MGQASLSENGNRANSVIAPLTFTLKKPEKLVYLITDMGEDETDPEYEKWYAVHDVEVTDVRDRVGDFSLDREGFELLHAGTAVQDFYDEQEVENVYNPEVEKLVKQATGADRVLIFDHTIRISDDDLRRERKVREAVDLAHNDYTITSGPQRVRDLYDEDEAERLLKGRFAIVNLWRSIAGAVECYPLGLCDARSVHDGDWVPCDLDYGDRMGEIYNVAYNPDQRWCYVPDMTSDEVLIFKNYDSAEDGRTRFIPHTAFRDPTSAANAKPRESIETRVLAFLNEKTE